MPRGYRGGEPTRCVVAPREDRRMCRRLVVTLNVVEAHRERGRDVEADAI